MENSDRPEPILMTVIGLIFIGLAIWFTTGNFPRVMYWSGFVFWTMIAVFTPFGIHQEFKNWREFKKSKSISETVPAP